MMAWVKVNMNQEVKVQLTDFGRERLRKNHELLLSNFSPPPAWEYKPPKEDANGWSKWQLWHLIQEFGGDGFGMGMPEPFALNILLELEDQV